MPAPGPWRVVPVRESALTSLFRGVLLGRGSLALCVHVAAAAPPGPAAAAEGEANARTLRFGALAARLEDGGAEPVAAAGAAGARR